MKRTSTSRLRQLILYAMLGALMLIAKILFEPLPNIHPLAALVVIYTVVWRTGALVPIYIYVFLQGLIAGFNLWWFPYLYIWTVLWGIAMLIPKNTKPGIAIFVYPVICAFHGIIYGVLYAPAQAILFNFDFQTMIKWILAGLPFDALHAVGNFAAGFLVFPISKALSNLEKTNKENL